MDLDPTALRPADRYKVLIGTIVPRPIALVSTVSATGIPNLAPFSFFTGVGSDPMTVLFCPVNLPDGSEKDSLHNAQPRAMGGTGCFVVNAAVEAYARAVAAAAEPLPPDQSEFGLVGLTPAPSVRVPAPRVLESPWSLECRTLHVLRTRPGRPGAGNIVVGEVVHIHLADDLIDERLHVDPDRLAAVGRMGGLTYCRTRDRFTMPMGRQALEPSDPATKQPPTRGG